jgi:Tfp pilus assembly protein PilX
VVLYVVIGVVIYGGVYYFLTAKNSGRNSASSSYPAIKVTPTAKPTIMMQKFSDSSDFQYAYKIFPGALSSESKQAMAGFAMTTKTLPDNSTQVTLTAQKPEYKSQQYTVKSGYTLYFIERNLKDDNPEEDSDANLHDDTAILVDPQGNIAQ